ncbi:MAG TPA: sugar porter family MFS transporter [Mycobacterium sp.]|nr:sugar porter family MFS transporter [Mycobacterium sp.]
MTDTRFTARLVPVTAISAASVGIIYGYDLSTFAGALRYITDEFGLSTHQQEMLTVAVVVGEVAGAIGGGPLANAIGRKKSTVLATAAYATFAAIGAASVSMPMLLAARLLVGLAVGVSLTVVPVFIAECAPARVRGSLLVGSQLTTIFGIIAGYLIAYLLAGSHSWRAMLGLAALPAVIILLLLLRLPDTARWYMLKGRIAQARQALVCLEPEAGVEAELAEIASAVAEERGGVLTELLRHPYRRATIFVVGLGFLAHITGINATIYYSSRLFEAMGFTGDFGLLGLPAVVQLAGLVAVIVSLMLVDQLGRRPILLSGIGMMIVADAVFCVAFALRSGFAGIWVGAGFVGVLLFTAGFSFGFGAIVGVYAGECFPARLRSVGSGLMITADLVANAMVAAVFLTMLHSLGGAGTFTVFGTIALAAFAFVYWLAPETKGTQLEDIRHLWGTGGVAPAERITSTAAVTTP